MSKISIAYSSNKKFFNLCLTSIVSILRNNQNAEIHIVILHSELGNDEFYRLDKLQKIKKFHSEFIKIDEDSFKEFPLVWTSKETWYRCVLADRLPALDKILYLDCDTIVRNSLADIWNTDLGDNLIGAVEDISSSKDHANKIGLQDNFYFNAGVLLLNLKQWRKENFLEKIRKFVFENEVFQADQGTLNKLADGKKLRLRPVYNYMHVWWRENEYQYDEEYMHQYKTEDPIIIHFTGEKPTSKKCKNAYVNEFKQNYYLISDSLIHRIKIFFNLF